MQDPPQTLSPNLRFVIRYSRTPIFFVAAFALAMLCYLIAGNSLDLFIGSVFFAVILTPARTAIAGRLPGAFAGIVGITSGFGVCWSIAVYDQAISFSQWFICLLVLFSFLFLLMSAVHLLMSLRCSPPAASAIVTITALLWLSWPVWLAGSLIGSQLHYSTLFHPLFALNHELSTLGIWTEQQVAYTLTNLGQDVQYQLPKSAWPTIAMQFGLAGMLLAASSSPRSSPGFSGM